ncbi:transporter [Wenjunlia vitaminophila]|uniref:Transporter n=1 Tax=Wenjunlia vitaminophila TaxID=76728 RepID=A0A0T6LP97_WENVI|nr:MMPL family transporter [Wenjunlia vitaminophila]KRV47679.1 transporter [Wenjunlia vitaminophila]
MLARLAAFVLRRRKALLYGCLMVFVLSAAIGGTVIPKLSSGGYVDSGTESAKAAEVLEDKFRVGEPNLVLLATDRSGVDSPAAVRAGTELTDRLAREPGIAEAYSYWSTGRPEALRSENGERALVMARIEGDEDAVTDWMDAHADAYQGDVQGLQVQAGGAAKADEELSEQTTKDLAKAEMIVFPVLFVVLVLVFRSLVAALIPLALGLVTMVGVFLLLRVLIEFTDVSVFAMNTTTGLGLGLAVDYSLFIISRYREELRRGVATEQAIATSMRTAGRTVLFSAVTVAFALSGLLVFPFYFLRSFAYAGIPTALLAATAALTVLPALLMVLGPRIDKLRVGKRRPKPEGSGFWHRLAMTVMRHPVPIGTGIVVLLLALGAPFLNLTMSLADERTLPTSASSYQVGAVVRSEFTAQENQAAMVVMEDVGRDPAAAAPQITSYARALSGVDGVARVETSTGTFVGGDLAVPAGRASARFTAGDGVYLNVVPSDEAMSEQGRELVRDLRAVDQPFPARVAGPGAELEDSLDSLNAAIPWALCIVALSTFVLLFLLTGSVVLPVKALVLNTLSLSATFGVLVWGFQDGHLDGVVGDFTPTGSITWSVPMLLFCVAFGLSMDYEVFLLSRIKEEYDRTGDNVSAVARGLERTGSLVSAAALLIAIVFLGFVTSSVVFLKAIGLGLALAVLMDATLVRGALVPAFMRVAGRANWWSPGPLRAVHERFGLRESADPPAHPQGPGPANGSVPAGNGPATATLTNPTSSAAPTTRTTPTGTASHHGGTSSGD